MASPAGVSRLPGAAGTLDPLGILVSSSYDHAIEVATWSGGTLGLAPAAAGVFAAAFWAIFFTATARRGVPYRWYTLMIAYSVIATLVSALANRLGYRGLTPPVAFATAAFAGAGIGVHIASPVCAAFRTRLETPRPAGGGILVGLPVALSTLVFLGGTLPFGAFLLGSAVLGLPSALLAVNAGTLLGLRLRPRAALALAAALLPGQLLVLALLPATIREF